MSNAPKLYEPVIEAMSLYLQALQRVMYEQRANPKSALKPNFDKDTDSQAVYIRSNPDLYYTVSSVAPVVHALGGRKPWEILEVSQDADQSQIRQAMSKKKRGVPNTLDPSAAKELEAIDIAATLMTTQDPYNNRFSARGTNIVDVVDMQALLQRESRMMMQIAAKSTGQLSDLSSIAQQNVSTLGLPGQ